MTESHAGVLLVHGAAGLDAATDAARERLSGAGYEVLAPDLSARIDADGVYDDRGTSADLENAAKELGRTPQVDPRRIAVLGLAAGGTQAFLMACRSRRVAALVTCAAPMRYGELSSARPVEPLEMALNLDVPLLAVVAEEDPNTSREHNARVNDTLQSFARDFELLAFPSAGVGFLDPTHPGFAAGDTDAAWTRILAFLDSAL